jgi:hypothetical protein
MLLNDTEIDQIISIEIMPLSTLLATSSSTSWPRKGDTLTSGPIPPFLYLEESLLLLPTEGTFVALS